MQRVSINRGKRKSKFGNIRKRKIQSENTPEPDHSNIFKIIVAIIIAVLLFIFL